MITIDYLTLLCIFNLNGTYFSEPGLVGNDRNVLHFAIKYSLLIVGFITVTELNFFLYVINAIPLTLHSFLNPLEIF